MKILIIDNYDSFTYNLYQCVGELLMQTDRNETVDVIRNNKLTAGSVSKENYDKIIISPGPGTPDDPAYFGACREIITDLGRQIPILGVCLGMQGIASCFGGKIMKAKSPMHGKTSNIHHDGKGVFSHVPQGIEVMRYHSLIVHGAGLPSCLQITATSEDSGEIMGLRHLEYPIEGIQFHPESFATERGKQIINNFLTGTGA